MNKQYEGTHNWDATSECSTCSFHCQLPPKNYTNQKYVGDGQNHYIAVDMSIGYFIHFFEQNFLENQNFEI